MKRATAATGLLLAVAATGCPRAASEIVIAIEAPVGLDPECVVARRAIVKSEEGVTIAEHTSAPRAIGGASEALRFELESEGSGAWTIEIDEVDPCGISGAHASVRIDTGTGLPLDAIEWDPNATCPLYSFARTSTRAAVYNACAYSACLGTVEKSGCSIDVRLDSSLSCGLGLERFSIRGEGGALLSEECATIEPLGDGDGALFGLTRCDTTDCESITLESDTPSFLVPLPPLDLECVTGSRPEAIRGALSPDGILYAQVRSCNSIARIDPVRGHVRRVEGSAPLPVLVHPPSGRVLAVKQGWLTVFDPDTLAEGQRLVEIAPGVTGTRYVANTVWLSEFDQILLAGAIVDPSTEQATNGLLFSATLSRSATSASVLYDRTQPDDVHFAINDPVVFPSRGRMIVSESVSQPGSTAMYSVRERELSTGTVVGSLPGLEEIGAAPQLLADPTRDRMIVSAEGTVRACTSAGVCWTEGKGAWTARTYGGGMLLDEPSGLVIGLIAGPVEHLGAHRLSDLSRRDGAIQPLRGTISLESSVLLYAPATRMVLVLGAGIERYRVR